VLNNKAIPLNKTQLRSIISTSLSKGEIDSLYSRFKQVGVTAEEAEWTYRMNTSENSPFNGILDIGLPNTKGVIKESIAYQLVSKFLKIPSKYKMLYQDVSEWKNGDFWDFRLNLFFVLWSAVKGRYSSAWSDAVNGNCRQILQKVCLLKLQEYILDQLLNDMPRRIKHEEKSPFCNAEDLSSSVELSLSFLTEEFFTKEWKLKGLDTGLGHNEFRRAIEDAVNNQSKNLGNQKLFRPLQNS
jgi:hypothetical protein